MNGLEAQSEGRFMIDRVEGCEAGRKEGEGTICPSRSRAQTAPATQLLPFCSASGARVAAQAMPLHHHVATDCEGRT
eukprot:4759940-Pleurochrysis_carterae.AAC.2